MVEFMSQNTTQSPLHGYNYLWKLHPTTKELFQITSPTNLFPIILNAWTHLMLFVSMFSIIIITLNEHMICYLLLWWPYKCGFTIYGMLSLTFTAPDASSSIRLCKNITSTHKTYQSAECHYLDCFSLIALPISEATLCSFVVCLGQQGLAEASIHMYLEKVHQLQISCGLHDPKIWLIPQLQQAIRGIKVKRATSKILSIHYSHDSK